MTKQNLDQQAKVIAKLLYNGDLSVNEAAKALTKIAAKIEEVESEESYQLSLRDCLDTPEAFNYKGKA